MYAFRKKLQINAFRSCNVQHHRNKNSLKLKNCATTYKIKMADLQVRENRRGKNYRETHGTKSNTPGDKKRYVTGRRRHCFVRSNPEKGFRRPEERRNPSKVCSKNPDNSLRVRNVLKNFDFILLNVVS